MGIRGACATSAAAILLAACGGNSDDHRVGPDPYAPPVPTPIVAAPLGDACPTIRPLAGSPCSLPFDVPCDYPEQSGFTRMKCVGNTAWSVSRAPACAPGAAIEGANDQAHVAAGVVTTGCNPEKSGLCLGQAVSAFSIDRNVVTEAEFDACVAAGACAWPAPMELTFPAQKPAPPRTQATRDLPAHVDVYGARDYCTWRGRRLPTESEWQRASSTGAIAASGYELTDGRYTYFGPSFPKTNAPTGGCMYNAALAVSMTDRYGVWEHGALPEIAFRCALGAGCQPTDDEDLP